MPPRLMWFDQDWTMAKCHRIILNSFLYILLGDLVDEPVPKYDEIFGLNDPREQMRQGFDNIQETALPFIVNVVNPNTESSSMHFYS